MKYRLIKADLLGNDDDGYEWNDSYGCGVYDIPEHFFNVLNDMEFLKLLVSIGVFDAQALKCDSIEIDSFAQDADTTDCYYFDFEFNKNAPHSRESFELRRVQEDDIETLNVKIVG